MKTQSKILLSSWQEMDIAKISSSFATEYANHFDKLSKLAFANERVHFNYRDIIQAISQSTHLRLIRDSQNIILGFAFIYRCIYLKRWTVNWLNKIAIHPSFQHQGMFKKLIEELDHGASIIGLKTQTLEIISHLKSRRKTLIPLSTSLLDHYLGIGLYQFVHSGQGIPQLLNSVTSYSLLIQREYEGKISEVPQNNLKMKLLEEQLKAELAFDRERGDAIVFFQM